MIFQTSHLAGLAAVGSVAAVQFPLFSQEQAPLGGLDLVSKPLINTEALQDAIKAENLLARAKELYKIAKLGEPEYNHPTRVIGSKGCHARQN
jgi:aminopeptidase Y